MSLLDAYKNATKDFDAKHDKISTGSYDPLPAGEYLTVMNKAEHFVSKRTGWEAMSFDMQVIEGEYAGRHEHVLVSLAEKSTKGKAIPDFVIARNIRTVAKISALSGVELEDSDFEGVETDVYEKLRQKFMGQEGATMIMKISETPNKKDPDNPYRNYDFAEDDSQETEEPEENDLPKDTDTTEVGKDDDEDLPF